MRYQYFLERLIDASINSPLELRLHGPYYEIKLSYINSLESFFNFVNHQKVKGGKSSKTNSEKLRNWFLTVKNQMAVMEKVAIEK